MDATNPPIPSPTTNPANVDERARRLLRCFEIIEAAYRAECEKAGRELVPSRSGSAYTAYGTSEQK